MAIASLSTKYHSRSARSVSNRGTRAVPLLIIGLIVVVLVAMVVGVCAGIAALLAWVTFKSIVLGMCFTFLAGTAFGYKLRRLL